MCCGPKKKGLEEPLNGDAEQGEEHAVDLNKLIDDVVILRLPRLSLDGGLAPLDRVPHKEEEKVEQEKAAEGAVHRACRAVKSIVLCPFRLLMSLLLGLLKMTKAFFVYVKSTICPVSALVAGIKKYFLDFVTNGLYIGVPLYLAAHPSSPSSESRRMSTVEATQMPTFDATLMPTFDATQMPTFDAADAETLAAESPEVTKFIIYFGLASSLVLLLKNVYSIMCVLFDVIDKIQAVLDETVDTLKNSLEEHISEHVANPIVSKAIADKLKGGIEKAHPEIQVTKYMPCPMKNRCYFLTVFFLPLLAFVVSSNMSSIQAAEAATPAPTTTAADAETRLDMMLFSMPSMAAWVQLIDCIRANLPTLSGTQQKQLKTIGSNMSFAFIACTPMIMTGMNKGMAILESGVNEFLKNTVKDKINLEESQADIDRLCNAQCTVM